MGNRKIVLNAFCNSIKNMKCFGINLIKAVSDLYTENYKMLCRDTEEDKRTKRKDTLCSLFSWIGSLKIVNVKFSPN